MDNAKNNEDFHITFHLTSPWEVNPGWGPVHEPSQMKQKGGSRASAILKCLQVNSQALEK